MEGPDGGAGLIGEAVEAQIAAGDWEMPESMRNLGWGGAGIWYNRIAQQNGALASAIQQIPIQHKYPMIMENIAQQKEQISRNPNIDERFSRSLPDNDIIGFDNTREEELADTLNYVYLYWRSNNTMTQNERDLSGNFVIDTINLLLGSEGLFEICR